MMNLSSISNQYDLSSFSFVVDRFYHSSLHNAEPDTIPKETPQPNEEPAPNEDPEKEVPVPTFTPNFDPDGKPCPVVPDEDPDGDDHRFATCSL